MWGLKFLIAETTNLVCAYTLTLEFYRTLDSSFSDPKQMKTQERSQT